MVGDITHLAPWISSGGERSGDAAEDLINDLGAGKSIRARQPKQFAGGRWVERTACERDGAREHGIAPLRKIVVCSRSARPVG
jgi:hypothetical protein